MREVYMRAGFTKKIELIAGVVQIEKFFPSSAARLLFRTGSLLFAPNSLGFISPTDSK
jgi:hypothetical protein